MQQEVVLDLQLDVYFGGRKDLKQIYDYVTIRNNWNAQILVILSRTTYQCGWFDQQEEFVWVERTHFNMRYITIATLGNAQDFGRFDSKNF